MVKQKKIPDGYKMSEVGVIPCEWELKKLKDEVSSLDAGVSVNSIEGKISINDYAILKTSAISNGRFLPNESKKILSKDIKRAKLNPKKNSLIISRMNTPELVGQCAYVDKDYNNLYIPDRLWQTQLKKESKLNCQWLNYLFNTERYRKIITDLATGTSNSMKNISKEKMLLVNIPFPNELEQKAIATALSDIDDLILSMKKLIDKKKLIKQGTMQELLSGKKRLDGFSEAWLNRKFNEVCWFQEGPGLRNWQFTRNGMKVINVTNIENGILNLSKTDRYIKNSEFEKVYKHFGIDENDIVVASSGNSYGKVAVVRKQDLPLMMNTSVIRFKASNELNYGFLLQFLKSNLFIDQINILITGGAQPNFGPAHLNKIYIYLPLQIEEQKAIAKILSDMDQEIEKLEIKLDKYKQIKKGMMEELLTGKRRLI